MDPSQPQPEQVQLLSDEEIAKFKTLFPEIMNDILTTLDFAELPPFAKSYYENLWRYNLTHGRKFRSEILILAHKFFSKDFSEENIHLSHILGWILEILHAAAIIGDTLTEKSMTSWGQPCWYLNEGVGLSAVSDITFLENAAFLIAKKHFRKRPYYADLMDFMHTAIFRSSFGKGLDLMSEKINDSQAAYRFSMNLYETVMTNKSAYTGFYLPVALAMIMSGIKSDKAFRMVKKITLNIGLYFQAQDDFLDVFGALEQAGRISSQIVNGKCSWPIVAAFERANDVQRKILRENYGQNDPTKISIIKDMFGYLNIQEIYWNFEYGAKKNIMQEVENLPNELPKPLFQLIIAAIAGRRS